MNTKAAPSGTAFVFFTKKS